MGKSKDLEKGMKVLHKLLRKLGKKLATGPEGVKLYKNPRLLTNKTKIGPGKFLDPLLPKVNHIAWRMNGKSFDIGI